MLAKWQRLDWAQRFLLLEAALNLFGAQLIIRLVPFRRIASSLGELGQTQETPAASPEQQQQARRIGWAVNRLARYLPWDAKCLAQAVAARWMLRRRRLPSVLYLGVDRGEESWLDAHAWIRCGVEFVTGERHHERYKVLATFTEDQR